MSDRRFVSLLLSALDFVSVVIVFQIVAWLRGVAAGVTPDIGPLLVPFAVVFLGIYLIDGYSPRTDMLSVAYTSLHAIAHVAGMLVMLLVTFVFIKDQYALNPPAR